MDFIDLLKLDIEEVKWLPYKGFQKPFLKEESRAIQFE